MTVDFNQKVLPINTSNTAQTASVAESNTSLNSVMDYANTVEIPEYVEVEEEHVEEGDVFEEAYGNSTVRKEQIDDALKRLAQKFNITDIKELEKLANEVLKNHETYNGKTIYEMTASDSARLFAALERVLEKFVQNGTFDFAFAVDAAKIEFGNQIENSKDNQRRKEAFDKYNEGSFEDYLAQNYPNLTREEAIKQYTQDHIFNVVEQRIANSEDKETVLNEIKQDIKTIIAVLRNDEERLAFLDVIKNSGSGFVTELNEFLVKEMNTISAQIEAGIKASSVENTKDIPSEDITGKFDVAENSRKVTEAMDTPEGVQAIANAAKECYDKHCKENKEALDVIKQKLANGEELTDAEEELLRIHQLHTDTNAGIVVGTNNHSGLNPNQKDDITSQILDVFKNNNDLDEISRKIAEIVLSNPEALNNTSLQELTERLNKLTDGKYSRIASEVQANIETQKLIKSKEDKNENNLGFENKKEKPSTENLENQKAIIENNSYKEDNTPRIVKHNKNLDTIPVVKNSYRDLAIKHGAFKAFSIMAKEVGLKEAIKEALENKTIANKAQVKKNYKRLNSTKQSDLIKNSGISSINTLLDWANNDAIQKLENTILRTSYATKALKEKNEEIKKEVANG